MDGESPQQPLFGDDKIGQLASKAWKEQEEIGWIHVAQGRLSKQWGEAQWAYYVMNPELKEKKHMAPLKLDKSNDNGINRYVTNNVEESM